MGWNSIHRVCQLGVGSVNLIPTDFILVKLTLRQIREIENLTYWHLFRDRFGLEAVADGVGEYIDGVLHTGRNSGCIT